MNKQLKQYVRVIALVMTTCMIGGDVNAGLCFSRSATHDDEVPRSAVGTRGVASQAATFADLARQLAEREETRARRAEALVREAREFVKEEGKARVAPKNQERASQFIDKVFDLFDID